MIQTERMRFAINLRRTSRVLFTLTSHGRALCQRLDLPFQLLDPTMGLQAIMRAGVRSTGRTQFLLEDRNIIHRRRDSNKRGSRDRRGGRSRHDNMRRGGVVYPEISKVQVSGTREVGREEPRYTTCPSPGKCHESISRAIFKSQRTGGKR